MRTSTRSLIETVSGCLIGVAILLAGVSLLFGDVVIAQSAWGGGFLALAGACHLVSALLGIRRRRAQPSTGAKAGRS